MTRGEIPFIMANPGKVASTVIVVGAVGLVAVAIETLRMRMNGWLAFAVVSIVLLVMAFTIHPAFPRDLDGRYANSPLKPWFDSLKSGRGPCCSDADGYAVSDPDWESKDGHYRVRVDGEWIDVPDDAVITEPNRAGRTMVWPIKGALGTSIRCFMPGAMT